MQEGMRQKQLAVFVHTWGLLSGLHAWKGHMRARGALLTVWPPAIEQEDAKEAFCQLLRDKKIGSESSWEQAMRNIAGDAR